jgi:hypothetical protein
VSTSVQVHIVRVGDDTPWPDLKDKEFVHLGTDSIEIAGLEGGMASGLPSVMLRVNLPDGRVALAETSVAALHMAVKALQIAFGIEE